MLNVPRAKAWFAPALALPNVPAPPRFNVSVPTRPVRVRSEFEASVVPS